MGKPSTFREALAAGPVLFDGATGTQIYERGIVFSRSFDELNLSQPDLIREIHAEYVAAHAQVVETNTFGANRIVLGRHGLADKVASINAAGVRLAREAADERAFVAGAMGPTGLDPKKATDDDRVLVREAFREQVAALRSAGADLLVLETFASLEELGLALGAARAEAGDLPVVAQMMFEPNGRARDGSEPGHVARALAEWGADAVGVNCGGGPNEAFAAAAAMVNSGVRRPVSVQPNAGRPQEVEGRLIYVASADFFATFARRLLKLGVRVVGGCCGTGPEHIRAMAGAVRMMAHDVLPSDAGAGGGATGGVPLEVRGGTEARARVGLAPGAARVADAHARTREGARKPMAERSRLGAKLAAGERVVSVEVNPPFGLDPTPGIDAARALIAAGSTVVNCSDGPRASVRMSNMAFGSIVQRSVGCEVILHVCCRDRNLLGLLSHLLGAHALGIRNLVVITGDPPKMGDYPDATAVYDVDSIGLLGIIDGLNHGVDPAGKPMTPTEFVCATGAEPAALDYDRELRRLEAKKAAGAELVMTQPVYDPDVMVRFLDDTRSLGLPILMGVLPLASHRNAEFLHNNVPGMRIPDAIRTRMAAVGQGPGARAEGVKIARDALDAVRDRIAGAYIMPPLGRWQTAVEVFEGFAGDNGPRGGGAQTGERSG